MIVGMTAYGHPRDERTSIACLSFSELHECCYPDSFLNSSDYPDPLLSASYGFELLLSTKRWSVLAAST